MSEKLDLCLACKQGRLRYTGDDVVIGDIKELFQKTATMRVRICDHCGHKQVDHYLDEYGEPASDLLSGKVTKANPDTEDKK
jgi:hypothetical protein